MGTSGRLCLWVQAPDIPESRLVVMGHPEPIKDGVPPGAEDRLDGWGEIADYFHRGVRTVQRWEKDIGLPVRRIGSGRTASVYALRSELDAWREAVETGGLGDSKGVPEDASPAPDHTSGARRWRSFAIAVAVIGAALGVGWGRPSIATRSGDQAFHVGVRTLQALEKGRGTRWSYEFDQPLAADYRALAEGDPRGPTRTDLDADGRLETLFPARTPSAQPHEVFVFDEDGRVRLRWRPQRSVQFGTARYDPPLDAGYLATATGARPGRFWAVARHRIWFPSLLAEVDHHGRTVAEYWNNGPITILMPASVKGRRVLLVGGAASEFWSASLAVLDIDAISGAAPAVAPEFACRDCPPGVPLGLVVFPRTDVGGLAGSWSCVDAVSAGEYGVDVDVLERVQLGPKAALQVAETKVRFSFDRDLAFVRGNPDDAHPALHDALEREKRIDHRFGPQDRAQLQQVMVWNGQDFVPMGAGGLLLAASKGARERH